VVNLIWASADLSKSTNPSLLMATINIHAVTSASVDLATI